MCLAAVAVEKGEAVEWRRYEFGLKKTPRVPLAMLCVSFEIDGRERERGGRIDRR